MPKGKNENWCDNYLCAQEKSDGKGLVLFVVCITFPRCFNNHRATKILDYVSNGTQKSANYRINV